jgi:hypothetical protein
MSKDRAPILASHKVGYSYGYPGEIGLVFKTKKISRSLAIAIAQRILQRRKSKPFDSWADFNRFIDQLTGEALLIKDDRDPVENFIAFKDQQFPWYFHHAVVEDPSDRLWEYLYKRYSSRAMQM